MSMTKEEKRKRLIDLIVEAKKSDPETGSFTEWLADFLVGYGVPFSPVSREQVEKIRGKFFQAGIDDVAQDTWRCSRCLVQEFGDIRGINFCPSCGAPMTDEAVDMVMERLEALKDGSCD